MACFHDPPRSDLRATVRTTLRCASTLPRCSTASGRGLTHSPSCCSGYARWTRTNWWRTWIRRYPCQRRALPPARSWLPTTCRRYLVWKWPEPTVSLALPAKPKRLAPRARLQRARPPVRERKSSPTRIPCRPPEGGPLQRRGRSVGRCKQGEIDFRLERGRRGHVLSQAPPCVVRGLPPAIAP